MNSRALLGSVVAAIILLGCSSDRPIGFMGGLSGRGNELATMGRDGARLFVESHGRRLVVCDTRSDPIQAAQCVQQLADSGVVVVIGPMISGTADSASAAATRAGVLLVSPTVSSHRINGIDDFFLRVIGSNLDQADTLASLMVSRAIRRPLVLWERKNAAYAEIVARRILERMDLEDSIDVFSSGYTSSTDLAFDSIVRIHAINDAVVIAGSAMDAALLCRSIRKVDSRVPIFGSQFAMGMDLLRIGGRSAEGMILAAAAGFADSSSQRIEFRRRFVERYRREPSFSAGFGWEAAAVSMPGWNASDPVDAKRKILKAPIASPLGDPLPLDEFGDVRRHVVPHLVRDGRFVVSR